MVELREAVYSLSENKMAEAVLAPVPWARCPSYHLKAYSEIL
jgi:hypothetical protein